ncbi:hypothetical protein ACOMHN_037140 [Nucella lapillus]
MESLTPLTSLPSQMDSLAPLSSLTSLPSQMESLAPLTLLCPPLTSPGLLSKRQFHQSWRAVGFSSPNGPQVSQMESLAPLTTCPPDPPDLFAQSDGVSGSSDHLSPRPPCDPPDLFAQSDGVSGSSDPL